MDGVLLGSIFTASLLGSLHCAGMCGGLVAVYAGQGTARGGWSLHAAYNLGRLAIYAALGAAAGALGAGLDLAASLVRWQHLAAIVGGGWMILWGLQTLARQRGWTGGPGHPFAPLAGRVLPMYRRMKDRPGLVSSFAVGTLSGLLPCGWLYLFVGSAAATGGVLAGMTLMTVFWLGTLPALTSLGVIARGLSAAARRQLPTVVALVLVALGIYTVGTKLAMALPADAAEHAHPGLTPGEVNGGGTHPGTALLPLDGSGAHMCGGHAR